MWQELYPLKHLSGPLFPFFDNWGSDIWKAYRTVERQLENSPVALRAQTRPHVMLMSQGQLLLPESNIVTLLYYVASYLSFLNIGIGRNSSGKDRV